MKYRIEIWKHHEVVDTYESDNIEEIVSWFHMNYVYEYENEMCCFYVYRDNVELDFNEEHDLGFFSY